MNGDSFLPVGVHGYAVCRVVCVKFIGNGNFVSALGSVKPAFENVSGANRITYGAIFGGAGFGYDRVVVAADCTGTVSNLRTLIVRVNGYRNGFSAPYGIKGNGFVCAVGKVLYGFAVLVCNRTTAVCIPTDKIIARAGKGVKRKSNIFVIGGSNAVHTAFTFVAVKGYGVGDRIPLCGIGYILTYYRFCGKLIFAVKPTCKGIALSGGV